MKLVITINQRFDKSSDYRTMFFLNNGFELLSHSIGGSQGAFRSELIFQKDVSDNTNLEQQRRTYHYKLIVYMNSVRSTVEMKEMDLSMRGKSGPVHFNF